MIKQASGYRYVKNLLLFMLQLYLLQVQISVLCGDFHVHKETLGQGSENIMFWLKNTCFGRYKRGWRCPDFTQIYQVFLITNHHKHHLQHLTCNSTCRYESQVMWCERDMTRFVEVSIRHAACDAFMVLPFYPGDTSDDAKLQKRP